MKLRRRSQIPTSEANYRWPIGCRRLEPLSLFQVIELQTFSHMATVIKRCPRCHEDKEFWLRSNGYACSYCKDCSKRSVNDWNAKTPEARVRNHERVTAWQQANRTKRNASSRKYYSTHKAQHQALLLRRRALKQKAEGTFTAKEWAELVKRQNGICVSCKEPKKLTVDHIVPLSKNGRHEVSNIQGLCGPCNSKKGVKIIAYL